MSEGIRKLLLGWQRRQEGGCRREGAEGRVQEVLVLSSVFKLQDHTFLLKSVEGSRRRGYLLAFPPVSITNLVVIHLNHDNNLA